MSVRIVFFNDMSKDVLPGDDLPGERATILMHLPRPEPISDTEYPDRCRDYVKKTGMPLVSAPFLFENSVVIAWISPDDEALQRACFPDAGVVPGDDVLVFDTPLGRMAMCCDADIFQPQYARLAALRGCQLLLCSTARVRIGLALPSPEVLSRYSDEALFLAGPWASAQANGIAIAFAGLGGGRLILPCATTADNSGLGRTSFDFNELTLAAKEFPVFDCFNPGLYRRYQKELGVQ